MIRKLRFANINKDRLVNSMNKEDYSLFSTKGIVVLNKYDRREWVIVVFFIFLC